MKGERMDLFEGFDPVSTHSWEERVRKDLKGKDPGSLNRRSHEGLEFRLINRKEEGASPVPDPGLPPLRRGKSPGPYSPAAWTLHHVFDPAQPERAADWLSDGFSLSSVGIRLNAGLRYPYRASRMRGNDGMLPATWSELEALYTIVQRNDQDLWMEAGILASLAGTHYLNWCEKQGKPARGGLDLDPATDAGFGEHAASNFNKRWEQVIPFLQRTFPEGYKPVRIGLQEAHAQGAGVITQCALALSILAEYADRAEAIPLNPDNFFRLCWVEFPVDTDFFAEIARMRAFRCLYHRLLGAYGLSDGEISDSLHLSAQGSRFRFSALDRHTNMLRATTEAMSAVFGGADRVSVPAFSAALEEPDAHAHRMARDMQIILMSESGLEDVVDPAGGSWYVEDLCSQIIDKAWTLFLSWESEGGYAAALASGSISELLEKLRTAREKDVRSGKETLVGVNQYPNLLESPLPEIENQAIDAIAGSGIAGDMLTWPPLACAKELARDIRESKTMGRPAAIFEEIRFRTEKAVSAGMPRPQALMCMFGDGRMRRARAQFAGNLLGCAGITTAEQFYGTPDTIDSIAPEFTVVMLCASDEDYANAATSYIEKLRSLHPDLPVYIAGKPPEPGAWGEDGHFAIGMDRAAWLEALQEKVMKRKEEHYEA